VGQVGGQRSPNEGETDVEADGPAQQVANLIVGLTPGDRFGQQREHQLRDGKAQRTPDLADDQLRDERLLAVPGAPELDDVLAAVIRLHERRKGAALA
jgi:hypothetical protein